MQSRKDDWWWQSMHSEIPQLEVITAIADSESEDYVAQLLFSQGWNIIHRAFDATSLRSALASRASGQRTVVIYRSDLEGIAPQSFHHYFAKNDFPAATFISLDEIKTNAHAIMVHIRQELRAPLINSENSASYQRQNLSLETSSEVKFIAPPTPARAQIVRTERTYISRARRVISVTGSAGAPGRTRFSLAIAQEIAREEQVLLVDADLRSQNLARGRDSLGAATIHVAQLDPKARPTSLPHGEMTTVVDLGTLPALSEAVTDRRWQGSLINHVLDSSTHLVYLTKSTPSSIDELSQFLREFPVLLKAIPITYLCILSGHSRALREWEAKFMALTVGENRHILRESQLDLAPDSALLPFLKATHPNRKEIGKILSSLI
jgi:hypothetical protein